MILTYKPSLAGMVLVAVVGSSSPPLALHLQAPAQARAGVKIRLELTVKNVSGRALEQPLGGRPPHDFVLTATDGTERWRWSRGQVVPDVLEVKTLQPGEQLKFEADWNQRGDDGRPIPPGRYLLRGVLNTDPPEKLETKPRALTISP